MAAYVCKRIQKLDRDDQERLASDEVFAAAFWEQERRLICQDGAAGFVYFLENYACHRPTGGGDVEPLELWPYQRDDMAPALPEERGVVCLKSRRVGFTLIVIHYLVWRAALKDRNARCVAISKNAEDASALLDTARLIINHLPPAIRPLTGAQSGQRGPDGKPGRDNTKVFSFPGTGGQIQSFASSKGAGRSHSATVLFLDELAHIPDGKAEPIWVSALPTIEGGAGRDGQVIVGSTGNGKYGDGATFFEVWSAAEAGNSVLKPIFVSAKDRADRTPFDEWYKRTLALIGSPEMMAQEYPLNSGEALAGQQSGLAFNSSHINAAEAKGREIEAGGKIIPAGGGIWLGIDWGANSASVFVYPTAGAGLFIAHELVSATDDAETFAKAVLSFANAEHKLEQAYYDSAGAQPMRSFARMAPGLVITAVPFAKYKRQTVEHIRLLLKRTFDGEETGTIAISPSCETLLSQMRSLRVKEDGAIDKRLPDHTFDALIAASAEHGEIWHRRYTEE